VIRTAIALFILGFSAAAIDARYEHWGPCGPGSMVGTIIVLGGMCCMILSGLLGLLGLVRWLAKVIRPKIEGE
jgi:hypothetical protein